MKYKDPITGEYKTLYLKTGDTLPVGTIVSFEGDEIPEGYEEVIGEEARVVISPTEPTTGEEVWIQKGKNLFNSPLTKGYLYDANGDINDSHESRVFTSNLIKLKENTTYTLSASAPIGNIWLYSSANFKTGTNALYFGTWFEGTNVERVMLEQSSTATSYEPYINKKINTKNDNGYEVFYDETNLERYSTEETRIGTWLGKPLYRRVLTKDVTGVTQTSLGYIYNVDFISICDKSSTILKNNSSTHYYIPVSTYTSSSDFSKFYGYKNVSENSVNILWAGSSMTGTLVAVVEYTKTTD